MSGPNPHRLQVKWASMQAQTHIPSYIMHALSSRVSLSMEFNFMLGSISSNASLQLVTQCPQAKREYNFYEKDKFLAWIEQSPFLGNISYYPKPST